MNRRLWPQTQHRKGRENAALPLQRHHDRQPERGTEEERGDETKGAGAHPEPVGHLVKLLRAFLARQRDLAEILGVTWEQLRYAIDLGRVTDCEGRDELGHRRWREKEVDRAVEECGVEERGGFQ